MQNNNTQKLKIKSIKITVDDYLEIEKSLDFACYILSIDGKTRTKCTADFATLQICLHPPEGKLKRLWIMNLRRSFFDYRNARISLGGSKKQRQ